MAIDRLINILVTITLIEMMAAIGMGVKLFEIGGVVRNLRLLMRAAIANYVSKSVGPKLTRSCSRSCMTRRKS